MWAPLAVSAISMAGSWLYDKYNEDNAGDQYGRQRTGTKEAERFQKGLFKNNGGLGGDPNYQGGSDWLRRLYSNDPELMKQFEQPYMNNFNENIAPSIANRFAGMGTGASGLSSSGFQQTLAQAGRGLQGDLANMRANMQSGNLNQNLQYAQQPINNQLNAMQYSPYQTTHQARQPGAMDAYAETLPGTLQNAYNSYQAQPPKPPSAPNQAGGISSSGGYNPNIPMGR